MGTTGSVSRRTLLLTAGVIVQSLLAVMAWTLNNAVIFLGGLVMLLFIAAIIIDYRAVFIGFAFVTFALHADITGKLFVIPAVGLNLYAMDLMLLGSVCAWFTRKGLGFHMPWKDSSLTWPLVIFLCSLPVFVGIGLNNGISLKNGLADLRLFAYYSSYFLMLGLVRTRNDLFVLFWAMIVFGIIGMSSQIAYSLANTGYDADTGKAVFFLRITGSQEGTYPMLFVASAAMYPFVHSVEKKVTLIVCNLLSIAALFLSLTRGSWVAALAAAAVLTVVFYMFVPRIRRILKMMFVTALILGAIAYILSLFDLVAVNVSYMRLSILSPKRLDTSTLIRFTEWNTAFNLFLSHPWTGVGLGYVYRYFAIGYGNVAETFIHNSYLYVLSKMGIAGLTMFLSVFGTALTVWARLLVRLKNSEDFGLALAFGLILIVSMVKGLTTWQLNDLNLALFVGVLLGVIGVLQSWTRKDESQ